MFPRRPSTPLRLAVCLLAALQFVATSLHVCALGGPSHCHPPANGAPANVAVVSPDCHPLDDPTRAWRMVVGDPAPAGAETHCLAALLATTAAQTSQTFEFSTDFSTRDVEHPTCTSHLCEALTFGTGPRGPPVLS